MLDSEGTYAKLRTKGALRNSAAAQKKQHAAALGNAPQLRFTVATSDPLPPREGNAHGPRTGVQSAAELLRSVAARSVLPELLERQALRTLVSARDPPVGELAQLVMAAEPRTAFQLIDRWSSNARSLAQLCALLLEPAARALGDLWKTDHCSEVQLETGLRQLHLAVKRAAIAFEICERSGALGRSVLTMPAPHETHLLGTVIAAEVFKTAGWEVHQGFPGNTASLERLVHERWFDVVDLSLSVALSRDHRLPAIAASVRAAKKSSYNPGLVVIVDGRVFREAPGACVRVGADGYSSDAVSLMRYARAEKWIRVKR